MAIEIERVTLWRRQAPNKPGALADTLEPLAAAGANLRVVMGYGVPGSGGSVIEVFPVTGKEAGVAAIRAGLGASAIPCLQVQGDDEPGLGARLARAIAQRGVNVNFLVAKSVGDRFSAVFGFASDSDAQVAGDAMRVVATRGGAPAPAAAARPAPKPAAARSKPAPRPKPKVRPKARPKAKAKARPKPKKKA
jgi:hypothetical protein